MVAVTARRNAAHVDYRDARLGRLEAHRGEQPRKLLEVRDVELIEATGTDRLDADRYVLEIFLALGRGDDDLGAVRLALLSLRLLDRGRRGRDIGRVRRSGRRLSLRALREGRCSERGGCEESERNRAERA